MKLTLRQIIFAGSILLFSVLFVITYFANRTFATLKQRNQWVQHTHQVLYNADRVIALVTDIQNGQRGYTITGDSLYLEPYTRAIDSVSQYLHELKLQTSDNPLQQQRIDTLQIQVINAVNQQKYQVMLKARGHTTELMQYYASNEGKIGMDNIRNLLNTIKNEEKSLLAARTKVLDNIYTITEIVLYGIVFICGFIIISLFLTLTRIFNKKEKYEVALNQLNQALYHSNNELQIFNEELSTNREELFATVEQLELIKNELEKIVDERTATLRETNTRLMQEISTHKNTEVALLKSQERLRVALENAQLIVFNVDKELRYTWTYNAQAAFGNRPVLGKTDEDLMLEADARLIMQLKQQVFASGKGVKAEIRITGPNNKNYYFISNMQPLLSASGEVQEITGAAVNITERKQSEKKLHNTLSELQKRNNEMDNYVYKVSHDLRAPLTSVMGLINLIHTEQNPEVIRKYVGLIENRIHKLDDFVKSVLSHSKSINSPMCITAIDFDKIINECTDELRYLKNADKLHICIQVQEQIPFHSDALRLTILFKNFISNAIKFLNPQAGQSYLSISVHTTAACTRIILADNGIGIDQEYIKKIYDMFFRATDSSDGSGLGLYIVKQNIETLQGNIEVESKLNKGTTFTITLPNLVNAVAHKEAAIV